MSNYNRGCSLNAKQLLSQIYLHLVVKQTCFRVPVANCLQWRGGPNGFTFYIFCCFNCICRCVYDTIDYPSARRFLSVCRPTMISSLSQSLLFFPSAFLSPVAFILIYIFLSFSLLNCFCLFLSVSLLLSLDLSPLDLSIFCPSPLSFPLFLSFALCLFLFIYLCLSFILSFSSLCLAPLAFLDNSVYLFFLSVIPVSFSICLSFSPLLSYPHSIQFNSIQTSFV